MVRTNHRINFFSKGLCWRPEVFVFADVVRSAYQNKSWMASAYVALRKRLSYHCSHLMFLGVFAVVYNLVNAGGRSLFPWFMSSHAVESIPPFKMNQPSLASCERKAPVSHRGTSFG